MATFNKCNWFDLNLAKALINFSTSGGHAFSLELTNTVPTSTFQTSTDLTEISTGNGYAHLGPVVSITSLNFSSVTTDVLPVIALASTVTLTAAGGSIGPFRYVVLIDDSTAYGGNPLALGWWDYGSSITLNTGETFTVSFDGSSGIVQFN